MHPCNAAGGGKVIFPAGKFLSGTVVLKDNVTLHFNKEAILLGSTNVDDYKNLDPFTDGLGVNVGWALLVAVDAKNIGIEGEGSINGQGSKLKEEQIKTDSRPEGKRWGRRPFLLRIVRCNGVRIKDVTLNYSAAWTSHYFQSKNILIENVKIVSRGVPHNDGIDIDGCQDVRIKDGDINSGDDAICFKTTSSKMACSNIVVTGMKLKSSQGAIKMGTESMAAFENIKISDCYIYETNNGGIKLLTVDGAHLRNIEISNITMVEVKTPVLIRLGIPGYYITDLTLENIDIDLLGTGTLENSKQVVPEAIDKYPEVKTFGPTIPSYGVWARHVKGLKMININFHLKNNDLRPAFIIDDGNDVTISNCRIPETSGAQSIIRLENVEGATIGENDIKGAASAFVQVEGGNSKNIKLQNNKIKGVKKKIEWAAGIKPDVSISH